MHHLHTSYNQGARLNLVPLCGARRNTPQSVCRLNMVAGQLTWVEVRGWLHCLVMLPLNQSRAAANVADNRLSVSAPACVCMQEAAACRTIAQRGVLLVSTAHGNSLGDLLRNPDLQGLMGGIKAVTLGDRLAHDKNGGHKVGFDLLVWCPGRGRGAGV